MTALGLPKSLCLILLYGAEYHKIPRYAGDFMMRQS